MKNLWLNVTKKLRNELDKFSEYVSSKPEVIAATKMDSVYQENLDEFEAYLKANHPEVTLYKISSIAKQGTDELISHLDEQLMSLMKDKDEETL